jgi:hypothetical protein
MSRQIDEKVGDLKESRTKFLPSFSHYLFQACFKECRSHVLDKADFNFVFVRDLQYPLQRLFLVGHLQ